jgi:hypothetical protein
LKNRLETIEARLRTGTPPPHLPCAKHNFKSLNDEEYFYFHKNQINLKLETGNKTRVKKGDKTRGIEQGNET